MSEAALEVSAAWEGEDVEECCDEQPGGCAEWVEPLAVAGVEEIFEHLAGHRCCGVEADGSWERVEEERQVVGGYVVRDDQHGTGCSERLGG